MKTFFRSRGHGVERVERGGSCLQNNKRQKGERSMRERFLIHIQKLPKLYCQNVYIFMCLSTVSYGNLKTMEWSPSLPSMCVKSPPLRTKWNLFFRFIDLQKCLCYQPLRMHLINTRVGHRAFGGGFV